ncbi:MAG: DUF6491 family protein [Gammaproteobacteria bacterium]
MKTLISLVLGAALVTGCASGSPARRSELAFEKYGPYIGDPVRNITAFRIDSWESVGRDRVILWTGINQAWLITVTGSCPDLQFADRIGVSSTGGQISTFDKIIVRRDRCLIETIHPIDVRQMKADRAAARN